MKLGPRLAEISHLVPRGYVAADIGTDHAYLPAYLVSNNISPRVIATDKALHPLEKARKTLELLNLFPKVELRLGDGLSALREEDGVEVIILAGMGGKTICRILHKGKALASRARSLIIQPMNDVALVRRWLVAHGFCLPEESLVRENGKFYEILAAKPGKQVVEDPFLLEVGPALVRQSHPLLPSYLETKINVCRQIQEKISRQAQGKNSEKYWYLERKRLKFKEVLESVAQGSRCY